MRRQFPARAMLWVILGIVVLGLFFSIRNHFFERQRNSCQINLENIGKALRLYQNDYGCLPPQATDRWLIATIIYGEPKRCPSFYGFDFGYGDNQLLGPKTSLDELSQITALVWDGDEAPPGTMETWCASAQQPIPKFDRLRHRNPHGYKGANILLADGHAAFFYAETPPEELLPFFDPDVAKEQTRITIKENEAQ